MKTDEVLVELRFGEDARDCVDVVAASLQALDTQTEDYARDPTIVAALTVAAAAANLSIELIKLVKELRSKGKREIVLVKLDENNEEKSVKLLEISDDEIERFVTE